MLALRFSPFPFPACRIYPAFEKAKSVWRKVSAVLYSKAFEQVLWQKMNITRSKWNYRDFRIQTDEKGFAIGAHPDISKKIATMMFYLPTGNQVRAVTQAVTPLVPSRV